MTPKPSPSDPAPGSPEAEADEHQRTAYIERNLWFALAGMVLFALALLST